EGKGVDVAHPERRRIYHEPAGNQERVHGEEGQAAVEACEAPREAVGGGQPLLVLVLKRQHFADVMHEVVTRCRVPRRLPSLVDDAPHWLTGYAAHTAVVLVFT